MHGELETDSSPDFGWKEGGMVLQDEERRGEEGGNSLEWKIDNENGNSAERDTSATHHTRVYQTLEPPVARWA